MSWSNRQPVLSELKYLISEPGRLDNKYSRGVVGAIAGSEHFPGAAILSIEAAIRAGAGMVRYLGDSKLASSILTQIPEVVLAPGKVDGYFIGPGINTENLSDQIKEHISSAINSDLPIVLDAGGIDFVQVGRRYQLITPHTGELSQLLQKFEIKVSANQIAAEPIKYAQIAAEAIKSDVLLKGNTTVIASFSQRLCYEVSDLNPWLATAGTGDVLTGIITSLIVQQEKLSEEDFINCAVLGVIIHSRSAEMASDGGPIAAHDLTKQISKVIADLLISD